MQAQVGSTLAITLIILLLLGLLAVIASRTATLDSRTARGGRDYQIAYNAAEAALSDAADRIARDQVTFAPDQAFPPGSYGVCADGTSTLSPSSPNLGLYDTTTSCVGAAWWETNVLSDGALSVPFGTPYTYSDGTTSPARNFPGLSGVFKVGAARAPRYMIDRIPDYTVRASASGNSVQFRVTAIGYGPTTDTVVVLQTAIRGSGGGKGN